MLIASIIESRTIVHDKLLRETVIVLADMISISTQACFRSSGAGSVPERPLLDASSVKPYTENPRNFPCSVVHIVGMGTSANADFGSAFIVRSNNRKGFKAGAIRGSPKPFIQPQRAADVIAAPIHIGPVAEPEICGIGAQVRCD